MGGRQIGDVWIVRRCERKMVSVFNFLIFATVASAPVPVESPELRCAGGAMIFFEPGSEGIVGYGALRLEGFVNGTHRLDLLGGLIRIESGGDGVGKAFDAELSRRRSEAIADFLVERGLSRGKITLVIGDELDGSAGETPGDETYVTRMGWVALRISPEEYARRYPPNLITECF